MSDTPQEPAPRCINLSCKAMLVYGEAFEMDPEYQGEYTDFWCGCTSRNRGPDDGEVSLPACRDRQRGCYKEF